jgi:hypothetical protein
MRPSQLTKRINDLSEKLKPVATEGIRIDFESFTEPEKLVLLKNFELQDKYGSKWPREVILANKELILKANEIAAKRVTELFQFVMPRALMLDEVEQFFFDLHLSLFLERLTECLKNVKKWPEKDKADFLKDIREKDETNKEREQKKENEIYGKENNN